jgi:hypothetical protein
MIDSNENITGEEVQKACGMYLTTAGLSACF